MFYRSSKQTPEGHFTANIRKQHDQQMAMLPEPTRNILGVQWHTIENTPLFSAAAGQLIDQLIAEEGGRNHGKILLNYGLLGRMLQLIKPQLGEGPEKMRTLELGKKCDPRLFLNVNAPMSAFICGSQGSGKSYTLACILENMLLSIPTLGKLTSPLPAIVFHFDNLASTGEGRPCELAYLASAIPVTVLVSPSNYRRMKAVYSKLKLNINIKDFRIPNSCLTIQSILALMAVDVSSDRSPPLYMECVRKILKDMAMKSDSGGGFDYDLFKKNLELQNMTQGQKVPLSMRLEILESFLGKTELEFQQPGITILDLSDPFVDEGSACVLFDICLDLFRNKISSNGYIIALDEAHKYMTSTSASEKFTSTLLQIIRLQRHEGARVIISTQEPTISAKLLDLCSITIAHRFSSPTWLSFMKNHIAATVSEGGTKIGTSLLMKRITELQEGEALIFAPQCRTSSRDFGDNERDPGWWETDGSKSEGSSESGEGKEGEGVEEELEEIIPIGIGYMKVKMRKRVTEDGGLGVFAAGSAW